MLHPAGMELRDAIRRRRMIRSYDPARPVPRDVLAGLLELSLRAPSAGHTQGWQLLVLDDAAARAAFWAATTDGGTPDRWLARIRSAPVLVIYFSDMNAYLDRYADPDKGAVDRDEADWPVPYWDVDTGMAALLLLLAATDTGLGACFFGVPAGRWVALREAFGVPERLRPVGVVSVGYPAPDLRSPSLRRGKRPVEDVVHYGSFD
jgi:nitroreductase